MLTIELEFGKINYSEEAIASIIGKNTMEVAGVVAMAVRNPKEGLISLLKKENLKQGISVKVDECRLNIEMSVVVLHGVNIPEICKNIVERVKYDLELLTQLSVNSITVNIVGVQESK